MPRARKETTVSDDGTWRTVEVEVGERGATKTATYQVPSNPMKFQELVLAATMDKRKSDDGKELQSLLEELYDLHVNAVDRRARSSVYVSIAQESTYITVDKERIDILTFNLKKLVKGINGMVAAVDARIPEGAGDDARTAAEKAVGFGPWGTARTMLLDSKLVIEDDGILRLAEGVDPTMSAEDALEKAEA